jgi:predicted nucleic acid binding AN1-type Zn finger protein
MSFADLNIARILEDLDEQYHVVVDKQEVSTIQNQIQKQSRPKKCCMEGCKKKLMLSDYPCKCSQIFCSAHRFPETHSCSFDFRKAANDELKKRMGSAVVGKKLDTI